MSKDRPKVIAKPDPKPKFIDKKVMQPNWASPFIQVHTFDQDDTLIITRGKNNELQVILPEGLELEQTLYAGNFSVFSSFDYEDRLIVGCFHGHVYVYEYF